MTAFVREGPTELDEWLEFFKSGIPDIMQTDLICRPF